MATRLTLISQGATLASRRAAFPADEPLEARALDGATMPVLWHEARVRISPMIAAGQTAQGLGFNGTRDPDLADVDFGRWSGQTIADIAAQNPEALGQWMTDPEFAGHGGESRTALRKRATRFLVGCADLDGQTVGITHPAVIRAVISEVLEVFDPAFWKLDIGPLTLTDLRHDGRRWALRQMGLPLTRSGLMTD